MEKRGQVAVFIVLGLLIVFTTVFVIYRISTRTLEPITSNPINSERLDTVNSLITDCTHKLGKEAFEVLGSQGKIYPDAFAYYNSKKLAYFYYKGDGYFPNRLEYIEEDISKYVAENLAGCVEFASLPFDIEDDSSDLKVSTQINQYDVTFKTHYPIFLTIGNTKTELKDFTSDVTLRFPPMYDLSKEIFKKTKKDPEWVDLDFLYEQPYNIKLVRLNPEVLVYEITETDPSNGLEGQDYTYRFAMKFE